MKWPRDRSYFREMAIICSLAIAPGENLFYAQPAQPSPAPGEQQGQSISPGQLDSLVAPIALYPDPLLAQVLAASTYPLEIVTADRWVRQNSNLTGKALMDAAGKQDWDPSVQALVPFPTVLEMLNQNLDWTTALGNAFLAQQADVMAAIQRMRMRAEQSGKLESTAQQQVQTTTVDGAPTIMIQPANPQVVYVPAYDPALIYGAAPYYPYPAISYPAGIVAASLISFGVGVAVGAIFGGCCGGGWGWGFNWGGHPSVFVNNNFFINNRNTFVNRGNWGGSYAGSGRASWNHNPRYRGAVPYPNQNVANRFNGGKGGLRPAQVPTNIGNIKAPGTQGSASRVQGNAGPNNGARGANRMPSNPANNAAGRGAGQVAPNARGNRPGGGAAAPGQTGSANRAVPGGQWGGWSGSNGAANRGGAFGGGSAAQARQFSNRGAHSMGGGGARRGGGGGRRR